MRLRRPRRRQRHRRHGVGAEARRHGLQGARRREGAERRREDDPAQQGLPDARLRELHLDAEDGGDGAPPERHRASPAPRSSEIARDARRRLPRDRRAASRASSTRRCAPAAASASSPARSPCPTSSTASWSRGVPPTSPSRRRCRRRRSIERAGTSPCTFACPAGIKAHGYVSLVRSGEYEKAFELVLETTPLVGSLGRACYAPCEGECTRGSARGAARRSGGSSASSPTRTTALDEPPPVERAGAERQARRRRSAPGPAGLTAAWQLARQGHGVKIFEAAPVAGRRAPPRDPVLPAARRGRRARRRERHRARRRDRDEHARRRPRAAASATASTRSLVATGTPRAPSSASPGEELAACSALEFLRDIKLDAGARPRAARSSP